MTLKKLIEGLDILTAKGDLDTDVKGVSSDSRKLSAGDLYVAIKGASYDGYGFINDAIKKGAAGVLYEGCSRPFPESADCLSVCVNDARKAFAVVSANFFGWPSEKLTLTGVTGTNGKTTTTYLIKSILETAGQKVGLIGTINYMVGDTTFPAPFTTPEAMDFQRLLSEMCDAGAKHVVSEVSSHALSQDRVDGSVFRVAVFTNLTRDHLDFHRTMEDYFNAKKRLFTDLLKGTAVINKDDPYGERLLQSIDARAISYGIERKDADVTANDIKNTAYGISFVLRGRDVEFEINSPLVGITNVYNALSAAAAALALGMDAKAIKKGISALRHVEGRFQKVDMGQGFLCVVDYAHTEDALQKLISTARQITVGRIITVFGCGGQRDRGKRPVMGSVATGLSDVVFITADNPRAEDPEAIIEDILAGIQKKNYSVIKDRKEAIRRAVSVARPGDTVLIAGKGHEDYQEIKGVRYHLSDIEAATDAIREVLRTI